jgi:hypothetical protein
LQWKAGKYDILDQIYTPPVEDGAPTLSGSTSLLDVHIGLVIYIENLKKRHTNDPLLPHRRRLLVQGPGVLAGAGTGGGAVNRVAAQGKVDEMKWPRGFNEVKGKGFAIVILLFDIGLAAFMVWSVIR